MHVAIAGYGTAGQAAAVLLARDGHRVEVFEQTPQPGPAGAGLLLQPTGLQVLWRMGLLPQALAHGAPVRRLYGETPCGRAVMDMRYAGLDARLFGLGMQRGALFALLDRAWGEAGVLHRGTRIEAADEDGGRIRDAEGRWHGPFDLVIAADGAASRLRRQVDPGALERPYPWGALWCLLARGDWPWGDELRQRYVAARKMIGMLPVGTRPDDATPRLSFFWSLPVGGYEQWRANGLARWREEVAAIWPQAEARLAEVQDAAQLARAGYRDAVVRRWHRGRLVLLGDAAHAMSPQLGQGVNMALMDALALRDALREEADAARALARYAAQRRRHVAVYQFWSRWLTPLFQSERDMVARARDLAFLPLGRMPGGRGHMLRVLSGTQRGAFGRLALPEDFVAALRAPSEG
ncbi:FAD-dependent oxidoreductase [Luteimonas aquatica]|uniref:FAD-dependent oxidoreductase n=1 Tax=Luteimonas aquatica TaxID=450364 RepID=UPI003CE4C2EC